MDLYCATDEDVRHNAFSDRNALTSGFGYNCRNPIFIDSLHGLCGNPKRNPTVFIRNKKTLTLQIYPEAALNFIIRVRNVVARQRFPARQLVFACHGLFLF